MLDLRLLLLVSAGYLGLLFAIAWWGDRRAAARRSLVNNPWVYALSSAVYCTAWTFYGSVGKAASSGLGFLPIYLGPTLTCAVGWLVIRKMVRITKRERITSIADLVASRYGKSQTLGALVTVLAVLGIVPYIALQLKAVATSLLLATRGAMSPVHHDSSFATTTAAVAAVLALFAILFGTRDVDVTRRHDGLVLAVAFESVVKLVAFLAVGAWVTFALFDGPQELFAAVQARPDLAHLVETVDPWPTWSAMVLLAASAILFLPRQFQLGVIECVDERHVARLSWMLPSYLLAINLFVLPIALAGRLTLGSGVDADTFVLSLPMSNGHAGLTLLVFIGGLSAATGMVIVESVALATMVSNDLILPLLLRSALAEQAQDLGRRLLLARRIAIVGVLALGQLYLAWTGAEGSLVSIGLVSFAAAAQLAPVILGGLYWRGATRLGALAGLTSGFLIWGYTLPLPTLVTSGWLSPTFLADGPFGLDWLRPHQLFGLATPDPISHSVFWSLLANVGAFVAVSSLGRATPVEQRQARRFVDAMRQGIGPDIELWGADASIESIRQLLERFLGPERTAAALARYRVRHQGVFELDGKADAAFVAYSERLLAGTTGAASARLAMATVAREEPVSTDQIFHLLDETSQVLATSRALEEKSRALQAASEDLQAANQRLRDLDRVKDDFLATMAHELRTPLTSIRAFTEILHDNPDLGEPRRNEFLTIVLRENERLSRLVDQVLDLAKLEAGDGVRGHEEIPCLGLVEEAIGSVGGLANSRGVVIERAVPEGLTIDGDRDRLLQVLLNLLSNALRFCDASDGWIRVEAVEFPRSIRLLVDDNGPGVAAEERESVFDRFRQVSQPIAGRTHGTGLGLSIARRIVEGHGGSIWVETSARGGARFAVELPKNHDPEAGSPSPQNLSGVAHGQGLDRR